MRAEPNPRASRKDDHVRLALDQRGRQDESGATPPARPAPFDEVEFLHGALDAVNTSDVDLTVRVDGLAWPVPFFINGMTGGTEETGEINRALAIAAREVGVPMATGSVSIALDDERTAASFRVVRDENPDGFVMANIGVGRSADDARRAVDLVRADALQLHVNAVQETVMPEGEREFGDWRASVEAIVAASEVPVIVKEVGFGLSRRTLEFLRGVGVRIADVGGSGGTDFARIENSRRTGDGMAYLIGSGQTTPECLVDAPGTVPSILASGGVRHPLDVARSLALGASAVGVAGAFLEPAKRAGEEAAVQTLTAWRDQTRQLLALFGARRPADLIRVPVLLRGRVREFCELRGIDAGAYAQRPGVSPIRAVEQ